MDAKLKILCTGNATYLELGGKTMGKGVESVQITHDAHSKPKLEMRIDLSSFDFLPDGYFGEVERKVAEAKPPEDALNGRQ